MDKQKALKGWEVLKMIDEWNSESSPILFESLDNGTIYNTIENKVGKGLRNKDNPKAKPRYRFSLAESWRLHEEYKLGEWIFCTVDNSVSQISSVAQEAYITDGDKHNSVAYFGKYDEYYRKAIPEEIQNELKRRKWAKRNRNIDEWKVGDVFKLNVTDNEVFSVVEVNSDNVLDDCGDIIKFNEMIMVCTIEKRMDKLKDK